MREHIQIERSNCFLCYRRGSAGAAGSAAVSTVYIHVTFWYNARPAQVSCVVDEVVLLSAANVALMVKLSMTGMTRMLLTKSRQLHNGQEKEDTVASCGWERREVPRSDRKTKEYT